MPHWRVPTTAEVAVEGGTLYVNACLTDSPNYTETQKKVTCKKCKALILHPNSQSLAAARLLQQVNDLQEKFSQPDGKDRFHHVIVSCNGCGRDCDCSAWLYDHQFETVATIIEFLLHVAFDHMGGAEVNVAVVEDNFSAYELNYAMGKQPMTVHEENWRERHELVPVSR